jgi:putative adenylate-forming enzyme
MLSRVALAVCVLSRRRRLERSCTWSRERLQAHQRRCIERLRRFAYERSPFYRRFHAGLMPRPFEELPILTKGSLMENFDELVTDRAIRLADLNAFLRGPVQSGLFRNRYVVLATSGSTGQRGVFVFSGAEWVSALALISRPMGWAGVRQNVLRPRRMAMVASTTAWHYSARVSRSLATPLIPSLNIDASEPLEAIVRRLNAFQPEILAAYPSILRQLAGEARAGRLRIAPRNVSASAEVLTDETRRRVVDAWGIRAYDTYGASEYAPIAAECALGRRHLVEDAAYIEIVDDRGRPVPPGVPGARVLLTVFDRCTQPLIRYEISDMLTRGAGQCACGRPFAVIDAIEGREEDVLVFPRGSGARTPVDVHPHTFHELLEALPAASWQISQTDDGLRIALVGLSADFDTAAVVSQVRLRLEMLGADPGAIVVERAESVVRGRTGKAALIRRAVADSESALAR